MAAVKSVQSAEGPDQVRLQVALARGAVELAAALELLPATAVQDWRMRLDSALPAFETARSEYGTPEGLDVSTEWPGGRHLRSHLVETSRPLRGGVIAVAHTFERALGLEWFHREGDAGRRDLLRESVLKDSRGRQFVCHEVHWLAGACVRSYGVAFMLGEEEPLLPATLELRSDLADVVEIRVRG